jgi:hypothetical protein
MLSNRGRSQGPALDRGSLTAELSIGQAEESSVRYAFLPLLLLFSTIGHRGAFALDANTASADGPAIIPSTQQAAASGKVQAARDERIGPRFDVTRLGAVGDSATDDTAAIQAAFDACWNHGMPIMHGGGYGGVVEFPGARVYTISSTIYTHDSCRLEGMVNSLTPSVVQWNGPAAGVVYSISGFTIATNSAGYTPAYAIKPSHIAPYTVTFPVANTVSINDWVLIRGLSTPAGHAINNTVAQVVAASKDSLTVVVPFVPPLKGNFVDAGQVTTINVMFASDTSSRYFEEVKDIQFQSKRGIPEKNRAGVDFYFGSRVDTGTKVLGSYATAPLYFGYYFSDGGIDIDFDKGWRADNPGIAGIYWRVSGQDNLGMENGTVSSNSGGAIMLDNSACNQGFMIRVSSRNMGMEVETQGLAAGLGIFNLLDCPGNVFPTQFAMDMENTKTAADEGAVNYPTIVMSPPNDSALNLNIVNGVFPNGKDPGAPQRWVGLPALSRNDASGQQGYIPSLTYAPPFTSAGNLGTSYNSERAMSQCIGDCNVGRLWQYGVEASPFLYSDAAFTSLARGTTLFAGQVLATPSFWKAGNGGRYAFDVVSQPGTVGIPNNGETTCQTTGHGWQFVCSSAEDLSVTQHINVGPVNDAMVTRIDATNPLAVLVSVNKSVGIVSTPTKLSFSAPLLAPEIQIPTKQSNEPNGGAWAKGDAIQNSLAASNGVAGWVNISGGVSGRWAGVPLGDSQGKINAAQISGTTGSGAVVLAKSPALNGLSDSGDASFNNVTISGSCSGCVGRNVRTVAAFCTGRATGSATLTMFGAGTNIESCTASVNGQSAGQLLMNTSGIASGLAVRCGQAGVTQSSGVFKIWDLPPGVPMSGAKSGIDTGISVTYGTVIAGSTQFDDVHTFTYKKGDLLRIQFTTERNETLGDCNASFNY